MNNILFMPSWYPTKENPINGSFFKEQLHELCNEWNFVVLREYSFTNISFVRFVYRCFGNRLFSIKKSHDEKNIPEISISICILDSDGVIQKILRRLNFLSKINSYVENFVLKKLDDFLNTDFDFTPNLVYGLTAQVNCVEVKNVADYFNIPYVLAEHCPFPLQEASITKKKRDAINGANALFAISNDKIRQMMMQGITKNQFYVGNMIDDDKFHLKPFENATGHIFTILIVAAYNLYKDYETFFRTIQLLRKKTSLPFCVKIVGFAPTAVKNEWSLGEVEFVEAVKSFGIYDVCELIPFVSRDEIEKYYHNADVFVMTSIQEGMPVSALEASSCGLPIFSTRCGGVEDYVSEKNGRLVNIRDYEKLTEYLRQFIEGEIFFDSKEIRRITVERFGKKAFVKRISSSFNNVICGNVR